MQMEFTVIYLQWKSMGQVFKSQNISTFC